MAAASHGTRWLARGVICGALAAALPGPAAAAGPTVHYVGHFGPEGLLASPATLAARAETSSGRIVAVTFVLDGRPLGTDTTAPYVLDVTPGLLRPGSHRLRVVAVDNRGRRASTGAIAVRASRSRARLLTASPQRGLKKALEALRRGSVTVRLAPGHYRLREVQLGHGARLLGSGARTVIAPPVGSDYWALLIAKGDDIRISDLVLDGGGGGRRREGGIGVAVFDGSNRVRLQRLRIRHVRTHGVDVWGAHADVSIQDSTVQSDGSGGSGVFVLGSDESRDTSVIRTRISGFRDYGILFAQREYGRRAAALHALALDNTITDVRDPARDACTTRPNTTARCGTNEGGIWSGGVEAAIIGNTIRRARWDGIETVGSSTRTTVVGNVIAATRTGIYLEHSTNDSLISGNLIAGARTGINVEWRHEGVGSSRNTFTKNRLVGGGLFVDVGGDGNLIAGNVFVGGPRPAIVLQGSSNNVVRANVGCGRDDGTLVGEQVGKWDDGRRAYPRENRVLANRSAASCGGSS
jgi:Periplasmic copper-binding protein (NosD)/Bacterial Ig domain